MSAHSCSFTVYVGIPSLFRRNPFIRLSALCRQYCGDSFSIETLDIRDDRKSVVRAGIFVTVPGIHRGTWEVSPPPKLFSKLAIP
jgi:hypothetical protein